MADSDDDQHLPSDVADVALPSSRASSVALELPAGRRRLFPRKKTIHLQVSLGRADSQSLYRLQQHYDMTYSTMVRLLIREEYARLYGKDFETEIDRAIRATDKEE